MKINGVFEIALKVKDLNVSSRFYQEVLGLNKGLHDELRRRRILWVGNNAGMVVLQEDKGDWPIQHFAFGVDESALGLLTNAMESRNIKAEGPALLGWMNAASLYFPDPDGHALEFCAIRD